MLLRKPVQYILGFIIGGICVLPVSLQAQNQLPYPVIFIHGLAGSETTFGGTLEYLRDEQNCGPVNVFDIVLNADDNTETALLSEDVRWEDFVFNGDSIFLGRRNYDVPFDDYTDTWTGENLFVVNFKEENIRGANGILNDYFDQSNQSAIFKQGFALNIMISEVLDYTGADKVVLVGHSMGGLAIREYLQRTDGQGTHVNWQNPWVPDGHRVARVVTFGTPHLGSNTSPDPTKSNTPSATGNSEANRDMLWEYDSYNFCEDSAVYKGIYMFGGYEHCIESESGLLGNSTFDNVDINCDGDHDDYITGINESYYTSRDNPDMPLPHNIRYTWLTSIWSDWASNLTGDGAVAIERQWLHENGHPVPAGITDTCLTNVFHTSEGGDYATVMRGLDEPEQFSLAYTIHPGDSIMGFISLGQNYSSVDKDMFLIPCNNEEAVEISVNGDTALMDSIFVYDKFQSLLVAQVITDSVHQIHINLPDYNTDSLYVCVSGSADPGSWQYPYHIVVRPDESVDKIEMPVSSTKLYPNPANQELHINTKHNNQMFGVLTNLQGKKVMQFHFYGHYELNTSSLMPGIYCLSLKGKKVTEHHKIIITKR